MKTPFLYFCKLIAIPIAELFTGKIEGEDNIPHEGNFIIASNHINSLDHFFIASFLKKELRDLRFIGAMDSFINFVFAGFFYYLTDTIAVNRKKNDRNAILVKIEKCLKNGKIIVIYPEGDTNRKKELLRGKTGIAELSFKSNLPIIPVGLIKKKGVLKREIKIGKSLYFSEQSRRFYEIKQDKKMCSSLLRKTTDKIMQEISKLSQKPYRYDN